MERSMRWLYKTGVHLMLTCALLVSAVAFVGNAQAQYNPTLQHVTLVVSDYGASSDFYTQIVGAQEISAPWLPNNQGFFQLGPDRELHIGEVSGIAIDPSTFDHFAFSVPDFDGYLSFLRDNAVAYGSLGGNGNQNVTTRPDGLRQTYFQDPDGYWVEVNSYTALGGPTLHHKARVVSDFSQSHSFYAQTLQMGQISAPWLPPVQAYLQVGPDLELHVGEVNGVAINPNGFNHFAYAVSDFSNYLNYLTSNGIAYGSLGGSGNGVVQTRPDGVRQTFFQDPDGNWVEVNDYMISATYVDSETSLPVEVLLKQNHPNPFHSATTVTYTVPNPGHAALTVIDMLGKTVLEVSGGMHQAGEHTVRMDMGDLPSGMYVYRLVTPDQTESRVMIKIR